jgi:hypothetical protein
MMVQTIAEAHGGSVSVESSESEGTIFTLDILCDVRQKLPPQADADREDMPKPLPARTIRTRSLESNQ